MNYQTYRNNIISKNNIGIKSNNGSQNTQRFILSVGKATLLVLIIILLVYVIYYTYLYYSIPCEMKIPYFKYLTNFGQKAFCLTPDYVESESMTMTGDGKIYKNGILTNEKDESGKLIDNNDTSNSPNGDEVFQISNQTYSWDEAKCKCEAYGARLATKAELTEAYNKGAHWCNYGWISGGEAYYPVQQCELDRKVKNIRTYNDILKKHYEDPQKYTLQMVNEARNKMERENSTEFCGNSAGLHGGIFENKNLRFGATCFGKKPYGMSVREKDAKCEKSEDEKEEEKRAEAQKKCNGKASSDIISPFNPDQWYK
jgi:hypothetical protein